MGKYWSLFDRSSARSVLPLAKVFSRAPATGSRKICTGAVLFAGLAFTASLFINPGAALAGNPIFTCAQLDPAQGGTPTVDNNIDLTVIAGDRITVTLTTGTQINADPPGAPPSAPVANPFIQDINAGNAGTWNFNITGGGGLANFSCAVGGATVPGNNSNTVAALQNSLNSVSTGLLDNSGLPLNGNGGGNGNGVTFAPTGLALNQSRIDSANPLDRQFGSAFAPQGYFAGGQTGQRGNGFNFSVNLQQMAKQARSEDADALLGVSRGGAKDGPYQPTSRFNSWVRGEYVDFDDDETNADRDGYVWNVISGLSYQLNAQTNVGVFSRYRDGEVDSNALMASLDTQGYGGGAFISTTLANGVRIAAAALYEEADNDIVIAGARGDFDSDQLTLEGRIDKRFTRGSSWIEPVVKILYIDTDQDNYTDSNGALVANQDLTLGRLTFGPTIGTTIIRGDTEIRPFAKLNGVWDFENEGNFATVTAGTFTSGDSAINLGGGVEVEYASGMKLKLAGDWFGFDSDLEYWSISGGFGAPLSAFGLGSVGFVSLDLSSNGEDASAKARIRIPLGKAE